MIYLKHIHIINIKEIIFYYDTSLLINDLFRVAPGCSWQGVGSMHEGKH